KAKSAEQQLLFGGVGALISAGENDSYAHDLQEKCVWILYLLAQVPCEMALTCGLRIKEKKHLCAGEDYFLSNNGLDTFPGLSLA
ncbi:regulator, partial [Escherichia coli]|nr:regulator [Escherichia coli]